MIKKSFMTGLISILLFYGSMVFSEINIKATPTTVPINETIQLTITSNTVNNNNAPDFRPLTVLFNILGQEQNTQITVINHQIQSISSWVFILSPKTSGKLTIPSLQIGQEKTKPLSIMVTSSDNIPISPNNPYDNTASLTPALNTSANASEPYINQEIIYTVTIKTHNNIVDASYIPPKIQNGLLIPLSNTPQQPTWEQGSVQSVEQLTYAIFPQQSGKFTITPPILTVLINGFSPKRMSISAKKLILNVKPIPTNMEINEWLPAKKVLLSEKWSIPKHPKKGDVISRVVSLDAMGMPGQLLPLIPKKSMDNIQSYQGKPILSTDVSNNHIHGTSSTRIDYLISEGGTITLPYIQIPWFNTETQKKMMASLPSKTITIPLEKIAAEQKNKPQQLTNKPVITSTTSKFNTDYLFKIIQLFAVGSLIAAIITITYMVAKKRTRNYLRLFKKACKNNDPQKARETLLNFVNTTHHSYQNLTDLAFFLNDETFNRQVEMLNKVLYDPSSTLKWKGKIFYKAFLHAWNRPVRKPKQSKSKIREL